MIAAEDSFTNTQPDGCRAERARRCRGPLDDADTVGLNQGGDSVAVRNDLAARDLRRVRNHRVEVLVADPLRDELLGLVGLLGGLEETKRAQDAAVRLDQVVAGETGELAKLRHERLVDLADDLVHAGRVDTFVATNGGMHVMLLLWSYRAERSNERTAAVRPGVTVGEEVLEPRRLQQQEPTRWFHHSCDPAAPSDSQRACSASVPAFGGTKTRRSSQFSPSLEIEPDRRCVVLRPRTQRKTQSEPAGALNPQPQRGTS